MNITMMNMINKTCILYEIGSVNAYMVVIIIVLC